MSLHTFSFTVKWLPHCQPSRSVSFVPPVCFNIGGSSELQKGKRGFASLACIIPPPPHYSSSSDNRKSNRWLYILHSSQTQPLLNFVFFLHSYWYFWIAYCDFTLFYLYFTAFVWKCLVILCFFQFWEKWFMHYDECGHIYPSECTLWTSTAFRI